MTEIRFYHLVRTGLERALPTLLERTLQRGWRAVVITGSTERTEALNGLLWTYDDRGFLPHGSAADGFGPRQPIWITEMDEAPNDPDVLFLTDGAESASLESFQLVCLLFDGNDETAVSNARQRWASYREAGHVLAYWQQDANGRWTEKQRSEKSS
ncbi:MAG: DNA polymerase III subunit chi [Pseudomonadota bacterium]